MVLIIKLLLLLRLVEWINSVLRLRNCWQLLRTGIVGFWHFGMAKFRRWHWLDLMALVLIWSDLINSIWLQDWSISLLLILNLFELVVKFPRRYLVSSCRTHLRRYNLIMEVNWVVWFRLSDADVHFDRRRLNGIEGVVVLIGRSWLKIILIWYLNYSGLCFVVYIDLSLRSWRCKYLVWKYSLAFTWFLDFRQSLWSSDYWLDFLLSDFSWNAWRLSLSQNRSQDSLFVNSSWRWHGCWLVFQFDFRNNNLPYVFRISFVWLRCLVDLHSSHCQILFDCLNFINHLMRLSLDARVSFWHLMSLSILLLNWLLWCNCLAYKMLRFRITTSNRRRFLKLSLRHLDRRHRLLEFFLPLPYLLFQSGSFLFPIPLLMVLPLDLLFSRYLLSLVLSSACKVYNIVIGSDIAPFLYLLCVLWRLWFGNGEISF